MPCENYRKALTEAAAAGREASPELRSHLDGCVPCRAFFAEEQQLFAVIDFGVRSVANAEPPASFLPRVRAGLNEQQLPGRSWSPLGAVVASAGLVLTMALLVFGRGRHSAGVNPQGNTVARSGVQGERQPALAPPDVHSETQTSRRETKRHRGIPPPAQSSQVAVLIPAGQKEAFARLLGGLQNGTVKPDVLIVEKSQETSRDQALSPLVISPMEIKPLGAVSEEPAVPNELTWR